MHTPTVKVSKETVEWMISEIKINLRAYGYSIVDEHVKRAGKQTLFFCIIAREDNVEQRVGGCGWNRFAAIHSAYIRAGLGMYGMQNVRV